MNTVILVILACTAMYALLAKRLSSSIITGPMVFLLLGYGLSLTGVMSPEHTDEVLHLVAEIALVILLFSDASVTDLTALKRHHVMPLRMLVIGLPVSVVMGTAVASLWFPQWSIFALALVASILAPTDAALGQAVLTHRGIEPADRRALIVESGMNDGLALPLVLFFACTLATVEGEHDSNFLLFTLQQIVLGPIVGIVIGWFGGRALMWAAGRDFSDHRYEGIAAIATALIAFFVADAVNGNGFIAAFCAGLIFGSIAKSRIERVCEFVESEGQLLVWTAFLLIGITLLPMALEGLSWKMFGLIACSLFVVRPLAIWCSLIGSDAPPITRLFFGWFGPRGLATALFALLIVGQINQAYADQILVIAINTVWISTLLHGITAAPGARWYAARRSSLIKQQKEER